MKCRHCGFANPAGFTFCGKCGTSLTSACPQCGFESPPGFAFCGKCGASLQVTQEHLTPADVDHLRAYLPPHLVDALRFDLSSPSPRLLEQCIANLGALLKTIHTHLPDYIVEGVLRDPIPGQVGGRFIDGTLLFADISGFTAMSERLSRIGLEGAEEITAIVNRYFAAMLSSLREHQGQLVKFGGDALLGLFPEPGSAIRAVQAALRMQAMMSAFAQIQTSQGVFPLQMKVGIHSGRFFAAQLGAPERIGYTLFGSDVNATAIAESTAASGQIVMDQGTWQAIPVRCRVTPASPDSPFLVVEEIEPAPLPPARSRLSLPEFTEPTLKSLRRLVELLDAFAPYLPAGLLARIASDPQTISLQDEHRLVAVLFANVLGLTEIADRLGPGSEDQIAAGLNHYFLAMQDAIHRFGGVINKMDINDRGDKVLALFGAPLAHEDDAERAVRAALAMQETLSEINCSLPAHSGLPDLCLEQQIGISFGYVFAGYVGTEWRHEYTVMGDEVNLAARLMTTAQPGGVIVSSDVRRKVQALFELPPRGQVELKGKSGLVPIFSVSGLRAIPERVRGLEGMRSSLVGRQAEWEQLLAAMDQLLQGRGQIVSVTGEAGLGKSRLTVEMRQHMEHENVPARCIEGRCLSFTESVSFRPFHEILRQLLDIQAGDGEAQSWNKLRDTLDSRLSRSEVQATRPYLASFMNLQVEDLQKIRYLDAEALQQRTFVAISTLIEASIKADSLPLVLILEDIHWIDQASLALLEHLMPLVNRTPLMLLLLYRPERGKGCWQIHEKVAREFDHCATEIALRPLIQADSQELLDNLVGIEHWSDDARELLVRAEGNPLYLEEVIRTLIDDRVLTREDGAWRVNGELAAFKVPHTLHGVMMARLDRLAEPCRRTAQRAAVIGRVFPFDVLEHIMPENGSQLNQWLVRLQQHETVRETQRLPELIYTFKHAMMQQVCYNSLPARNRRSHHHQVAAFLETSRSVGRREAESNYPLIAHHAFLGQDWPRALRYQLLAGRQAKELFANHEAIDHFEKALSSAENVSPDETLAQRQEIHAALGELLTNTGQYEHALEHLDQALSLASQSDDPDAQANACRWSARLYELQGEYPVAFEWIEKGLAALEGRETAGAAHLSLISGLIHTRQGNFDKALNHCENSLHIAQTLGEVTVLARAHHLVGIIARLRGQNAAAMERFQEAFDLYQQAGDLSKQALLHNDIANAHLGMGQLQDAERHYRQAHETFDKIGDIYNRALVDNNLGEVLLKRGDLDDALAFYQEGLRAVEKIGASLWMLGGFHNNVGAALIRRGEIDAAREHLRASQEYLKQAQARDWLPELHRHFAEAALLSGDLSEAEAQGQQALGLAQELAMRGEEGSTQRVLGEIATAQGRFDEAQEHLTESLAVLEEVGDEYEWARSQLSLARWCHTWVTEEQGAVAAQRVADGQAALARAMEVFQRLAARLDLAAAHALREALESVS